MSDDRPRWRDTKTDPPSEEEPCLTEMKHGLIEGYYDAEETTFRGYYFQDITWYARRWMPADAIRSLPAAALRGLGCFALELSHGAPTED